MTEEWGAEAPERKFEKQNETVSWNGGKEEKKMIGEKEWGRREKGSDGGCNNQAGDEKM